MTAIQVHNTFTGDDPRASLRALADRVRRLWHSDPKLPPAHREDAILELTDIDLRLERAAIRSRWAAPDHYDHEELAECDRRLSHLEGRWITAG